MTTKACGETKGSRARTRGSRGKRCWERRGRRLRSVFGRAFTGSVAGLEARVSQIGLCGIFVVFEGAVEGPHSGGDGFLNITHLLGARKRDLRHESVSKGATCDCDGTFHFFFKSKNCIMELGLEAVEVPHLCQKKTCTKSERTGAELSVERSLCNLADVKYTHAGETPLCDGSQ